MLCEIRGIFRLERLCLLELASFIVPLWWFEGEFAHLMRELRRGKEAVDPEPRRRVGQKASEETFPGRGERKQVPAPASILGFPLKSCHPIHLCKNCQCQHRSLPNSHAHVLVVFGVL